MLLTNGGFYFVESVPFKFDSEGGVLLAVSLRAKVDFHFLKLGFFQRDEPGFQENETGRCHR